MSLSTDVYDLLTRLWASGDDGRIVVHVGACSGAEHHTVIDEFVAVPNARGPRFLVPVGRSRAMASLLRSYLALRPLKTRMLRTGIAALARAGALGRVLGSPVRVCARAAPPGQLHRSFASLVRDRLDSPGALMAIGVGRMDHHYKPTAQVFSQEGVPLGFAKVGWTPSTATLVQREAYALRSWGKMRPAGRTIRVPTVLDDGVWEGLPYVITQPLPSDAHRVAENDPLPDAAREVCGEQTYGPLSQSPYWHRARHRLQAHAQSTTELFAMIRHAMSVLRQLDDAGWTFGSWHGDWAPWNVARSDGMIHIWDWEHSATSVPWGFDLLHWQVTVPHLRGDRPYGACVRDVLARQLPGVNVDVKAIMLAYLVEMGLRSLEQHPVSNEEPDLYSGLAESMADVAAAMAPS